MGNSASQPALINRFVEAESSAAREVIENCCGEKEKLVCSLMLTAMDSASLLLLLFLRIKDVGPAQSAKIPAKALHYLLEIY